VRAAAERLGVDPIRLARFLSDGTLADVMRQLREASSSDPEIVGLAESYLTFLDEEMELSGDRLRLRRVEA